MALNPPRRIVELPVWEAYAILGSLQPPRFSLPPLEAIENEDWGRDWLLSRFQELSSAELAALGVTWDEPDFLSDQDAWDLRNRSGPL